MLRTGDEAPDFTLLDSAGNEHHLATLLQDGEVALYFYPADFSPVCTRQACVIRDRFDEFTAGGAQILGISAQDQASHARFSASFNLPFPLLHDPGRKVIRAYHAEGLLGMTRRITFRIGQDQRIKDRAASDLFLDSHLTLLSGLTEEQD